jgi:hypothetical protein
MKRHDIDVISLMGGLLFAGLAAVFALHALGAFDVDLRVAPAVALIVAGLGGIAAAVTSSTRAADGHHSEPLPEPVVTDRFPEH